ncbi:MAG: RDD family protein [Chloroflexota bacterium]
MASSEISTQQYAGFVSRAIALVVDLIVISGVILFGSAVIDLLNEFFRFSSHFFDHLADFTKLALQIGFPIAYFILFNYMFGQTPGKMLMGLRITTANGSTLSFRRAVIRFFLMVLIAGLVMIGYAWVLIDRRRRGWHDILARTTVVYTDDMVNYRVTHFRS